MKTEDLKKTIEELKEEIKKNKKIFDDSYEKIRMSMVNQFEFKFGVVLGLSMLPYLGSFGVYAILSANGIFTSIPIEILALVISGSSLGIGIIGNKILEKVFKTKERFNAFSTAKTQYEKLEEEIKHTIEFEKADNRIKATQETIDLLNSNQVLLNSLSDRYDIINKNALQSKEEAQEKVDELSENLGDKFKELDVLSTQKVLHKNFLKVRMKSQQVVDIMIPGLLGGTFSMILVNFPFILAGVNKTLYASLSSTLTVMFAPLVAGAVGFSGYMLKKNKDYKKIFDKLNNDLGEDAVPEKIKDAETEQQDIDAKIKSKIEDISFVEAQFHEQKRIMESFTDSSEEIEKNKIVSMEKNNRKKAIVEYSCEYLVELMDEDMSNKSETTSKEEKTAQLSLKK